MNARNRSKVEQELALRPGFSAQARMPPTARFCATRREAWVTGFDCGAGAFYGRYPPAWWTRPNLIDRAGVLALSLPRGPNRGTEGLKTMTRTAHNSAARRRGEVTGDRGSRRLSPAIDAQRRLNAQRADGTPTPADPFGPNDRRYAYLTRSSRRLAKRGDVSVDDAMNERELYRQIISRAKTFRERAAESLRRSPRVAQEARRPRVTG